MKMQKKLIEGGSYTVPEQIENLKGQLGELKQVTVFFNNQNFIITKYKPLSNGVHMILEFDNEKELHITSANCGYGGAGPNAAIEVLEMLGLDKNTVSNLIYYNEAVSFKVKGNQIYQLDTSFLICDIGKSYKDGNGMRNKIINDANVSVNLEKRKITIYNPQRTCWIGFLNLLDYMGNIQMEYYIGENEPLEDGFYVGQGFASIFQTHHEELDLKGTEHVNLVLHGEHFEIVCLIDREIEKQVIDAVYLALTGKCLFKNQSSISGQHFNFKKLFSMLWKKEKTELYDIVDIVRENAKEEEICG